MICFLIFCGDVPDLAKLISADRDEHRRDMGTKCCIGAGRLMRLEIEHRLIHHSHIVANYLATFCGDNEIVLRGGVPGGALNILVDRL